VGTAGHIDHGKSSLVRVLTGIDPDRWEEEKRRGMTIDLGFANFPLPDGRRVGMVDVPGHERFIRNMVAGATGIDIALIVVAADDGVMPQTREHLAILALVGVRRALVALTKIDAVEAGFLDLAREDVEAALAGTPFAGASIHPVSSVTGEGIEDLRGALVRLALETEPRSASGPFRMPIQRVFSKPGFGTVVTGIPLSGVVRAGDEVELLPQGTRAKVRGLQAYGQPADSVRAGHSSALNLADADRAELARGHVVATPGYFAAWSMVAVRLGALANLARPIEDRSPVRLHVGTADPFGELVLLEDDELLPGASALVQLRLEEPVVVAPGDRFVLRWLSPELTLGGGVVLLVGEQRFKRGHARTLESLRRQESALGSPRALLLAALERRELEAPTPAEIGREVGLSAEEAAARLLDLRSQGLAIARASAGRWFAAAQLESGLVTLADAAATYFREESLRERIEVIELARRTSIPRDALDLLVAEAVARGMFADAGHGLLRMPTVEAIEPQLARELELAAAALLADPFQPPTATEFAETAKLPEKHAKALFARLVDAGRAVRISGDYVFAREPYDRAKEAVRASVERNGHLEIPELRDGLSTTRKWLIPLLEHFDAIGYTMRAGSHRVLRKR